MTIKIFLQKWSQHGFIVLLFIFLYIQAGAQDFLKADGKKIINGNGENILLRGMGFGGWMVQEGYMLGVNRDAQQHKIRQKIEQIIGSEKTNAFYQAWLNNFIRKIDIDSMKAWGFNSIRLPMHYNLYTLPVDREPAAGQNTWLETGFAITDSLLSWCKANKMYLILDLHAAPGGQGSDLNISDRDSSKPSLWQSEADQQKTIALWKKLAQRYKNEEWIAGYDILNEPNWGFTDHANDKNGLKELLNAPLKKLMQDITAAIREEDKNHIIIIEGNGWGNNYNGILPTWDHNMVLSFHKYWNYNRKEDIQKILDVRDTYNLPVWLGETGENSNVWYTEAIRLLEENNIGWAMWPLKKMGNNNPLQIRSNPEYEKVKNYLNGKEGKPNANTCYEGIMKLADDAKLENNIFHKDVIDALFRQPFSSAAMPYNASLLTNNLLIQAVDYDLGRNGAAYYDKDTANYWVSGVRSAGNRGGVYRNDGVDIYKNSLTSDAYYVGHIEDGEWLQYTISVSKKGDYNFVITITPGDTDGKFSVVINNDMAKDAVVKGDKNKALRTETLKNISLNAGINKIKILAIRGGFNLYSLKITR
ncbi:MAG: cellulase family glycosylhydrolase [Bacteroidota bacterium]|nr:cellulase family glycosylhydrolase [Bacteroidota bacterium]